MKYIDEFIKIKEATENRWSNIKINKSVYGFQFQSGTKWKKGLSEQEIIEFEKIVGFKFPEILRDYYAVMNGVDMEQINIYGSSGTPYSYSKTIYSFPNDIDRIKYLIKWVYGENKLCENELRDKNISRIFPLYSHRFMLIDHEEYPILSMYGDDIILFANNIMDLLKIDLLDIKAEINKNIKINYWLDCREKEK